MEKNSKYVIIGDGHGEFNTVSQATYWAFSEGATPIFLGDLSDSFTKSKREQLRLIYLVLGALEMGAGCLWGNHDLSYLFPKHYICSGYTKTKEDYFKKAYKKLWSHKNFKPYIFLKEMNILITHAGLSPKWVGVNKDPIEFLEEEFSDKNSVFFGKKILKAGRSSGGHLPFGGITWLREKECSDPLQNNILQIIGHTSIDTCTFFPKRNLWNVDSLVFGDKSILFIDTDKKEIEKIEVNRYSTIIDSFL